LISTEGESLVKRSFGLAAAVALVCGTAAGAAASIASIDVDTYHNDNYRTGWNEHESTLTPANVASPSFGLLFSAPTDGLVYGQPLIATNVTIPGAGVHDLLITGTENDTLFAYDAATGTRIWRAPFVNAATHVLPLPPSFNGCDAGGPESGLLSTPEIDRSTNRIYAVTTNLVGVAPNAHVHFRLHALSLETGRDLLQPVDIGGTFAGPKGPLTFDADVQMQRPALLESQGNIYVAFGSQCDFSGNLYHGWVFSYAAATLKNQAIFNTTPTPEGTAYYGGIWMSGYGLAADPGGYVYFAVGNGVFDGGQHDFGMSVMRMPSTLSLAGSSFFTPYTVFSDNGEDSDTGSGGAMLLPPQKTGLPDLAVAQGKDGVLFLLNRNALGGFVSGGPDNALAELSLGGVWAGPAYWSDPAGHPYIFTTGGPLYKVLVGAPAPSLRVVDQTPVGFYSVGGNGSTPSISSNGNVAGTAVVWIVRTLVTCCALPMTLYAFDAADLHHQLFSTSLGNWPTQDSHPTIVPTIANGKVYVATPNSIEVFGLKQGASK